MLRPFCLPAYDKLTKQNDICLVWVDYEFKMTDFVSVLPVNNGSHCGVGSTCTISGWGTTQVK